MCIKTIEKKRKGYYGEFGGSFVPELLRPNLEELERYCDSYLKSDNFKQQFKRLLNDYAGRPSPLYYAENLSLRYGTNIFLKREDLNHTGSHKINNTLGQLLLAREMGKTRIIAETGAGQHGVATATACSLFGLQCVVYMGAKDMERQKPNVLRMEMLGAKVVPVSSGSRTLKDATNEAIRDWINNPEDTHYVIGSVVGPHPYPKMVAEFQSVISQEIQTQLDEKTGSRNPDVVMACVGGGSNAAGGFYHFMDEENTRLIAVEAGGKGVDSGFSAATTFIGSEGIIHGSKTILMQDENGQITEPFSISAGLDYPGIGPLHAHLFKSGRAEFISATDDEALQAGFELAKMEGIIPALESAHALAGIEKIKTEQNETIVIVLSGRGDKDMDTYINKINKDHE